MTCETNRFGDDSLQLIDFSEEDDYLIDFPFRDSLEDLRLSVTFDNVNERINHVQSESVEPRRPSFLRKSLAWDSAFFTSAGVLNPEELFMINKGFKKAESNQQSPRTEKNIRQHRVYGQDQTSSDGKRSKVSPNIGGPACSQSNVLSCKKMNTCSQNKVKSVRAPKSQNLNLQGPKSMTKTRLTDHQIIQDKVSSLPKLILSRQTNNNASVEESDIVKMENKTRKAGTAQDLTVSKRSRWGDLSGLPKSTSFISPTTEKNSKIHYSYESSSKNFSKSIKMKINPRNTKLINSPSSVHFLLSSTGSSSTSPASSIDGWFSESLSSNTINHQNIRPVLDFQSQNSEERKLIDQNATRSSTGTTPFSGGPKRKIKSSGLRMPSPKIGFFDEEVIFKGSMQELNKFQPSNLSPCVSTDNWLKVRKKFSRGSDERKVGSSCSKLNPNGQEIFKKRIMNRDGKRQKDDCGLFQDEKENVFSFEDQVNGLSRQLEVIGLDRDVAQVKGQRIDQVFKTTRPCSTTTSAEKMFGK